MADAYTTFASISNDAVNVYITAKMLELAQRILVLPKIADQYPLEQKMSKSLRVIRVKRLSLPTTTLVEGVTPSSNAFEVENVDVTVEQWGIIGLMTDVAQITVQHPFMSIGIDRVSLVMKEVMEREMAVTLLASTNVSYPGAVTARSSLAKTDVFNTALAITVAAKLEMRGAPRYEDGNYVFIAQPAHKAELLGSDQVFQQASAFSQYRNLEMGVIGTWMGMTCILGNFLPMLVGVAAPDATAATATKSKVTAGSSGSMATGNYQVAVVARESTTDYERRFSQQSANISVTGPNGSIAVALPTSLNYTYDIYATQVGGTAAFKVASRRAGATTFTITTQPAGTEAAAPVPPANGVSVYPGWIVGRSAFGSCTLNGMALQSFVTPSVSTDSDPLIQRKKIGAKFMWKSFILDNAFLERVETSSGIDAILPA